MTEIRQSFQSFEPPDWLEATASCLLSTLPKGHLQSLSAIVLTDSSSMGRGKTRRVKGRKYNRRDCRGFYHRATKGAPAWIELAVDNILHGTPPFMLRISSVREGLLANTLYHEIGHHLDGVVGAPARTGESAAEAWSTRLVRQHFRQRHPVAYRVLKTLKPISMPLLLRLYRHASSSGKAAEAG